MIGCVGAEQVRKHSKLNLTLLTKTKTFHLSVDDHISTRKGLNRLDLTVGRFFFRSSGKMSSGLETVELDQEIRSV